MRRLMALVLLTLAALVAPMVAMADTVKAFDPAKGELPEGIAFNRRGSLYVSLAPLGEIRRRSPDGTWSTLARLGSDPAGGLAVLGLAADARGTVYAAAPTADPRWHGVVVISPKGNVRRLPGSEAMQFPNAIAWDKSGNHYVTDSVGGSIWRITPRGEVRLWLEHRLLEGTAALNPFPLGANGVVHDRGRLYVANTEKKHVVEVPIERNGLPGKPRIVYAFRGATDFLDGITVDRAGRLYVLLVAKSELVRIDKQGRITTLAGASDGLNIPASLTFGVRGWDRQALYVTNMALPDLTSTPSPAVIVLRGELRGSLK
ncbi:MAG: SMP-30/gluconolactonase/LRE family protein [Actinomycetes bacterium]